MADQTTPGVPAAPTPRRLMLAAGSVLDASPLEVLDAAAGAGFEGVGLRLSGEHALDPQSLAAVQERAAGLGLVVHDAEVHRITAARPDPRPLLEAAAAAGAGHLLVVSDAGDPALTAAEVRRAVGAGGDVGVVVAVEYMAWTTPASPAGALHLAGETGCRLVVDLLHHVRVGAGVTELERLVAAGVVAWVQVCDAPATPPADLLREARHGRLPPGDGSLPLAALLAVVPPEIPWSVEVQSDALVASLDPRHRAHRLAAATWTVVPGYGRSDEPNTTG